MVHKKSADRLLRHESGNSLLVLPQPDLFRPVQQSSSAAVYSIERETGAKLHLHDAAEHNNEATGACTVDIPRVTLRSAQNRVIADESATIPPTGADSQKENCDATHFVDTAVLGSGETSSECPSPYLVSEPEKAMSETSIETSVDGGMECDTDGSE